MKTEQEIRDRIHTLATDPRFRAPPADMMINTPLAIVQSGMRSEIQALYFVLDYSDEFRNGEESAATHIRRYGLEHTQTVAGYTDSSDDYWRGFRAVLEDYRHEQ